MLNTFSNSRGTEIRKVGRNDSQVGHQQGRVRAVGQGHHPHGRPHLGEAAEHVRQRQEQQSPRVGLGVCGAKLIATVRVSNTRFAWVSTHPFGRPVVPEV